MSEFTFSTDDKGREFCREIIGEMIRLFQIPKDEAVGRINREWCNVALTGEQHVFYHEDETFWAKEIYYGHDSKWWRGEQGLSPLAFP